MKVFKRIMFIAFACLLVFSMVACGGKNNNNSNNNKKDDEKNATKELKPTDIKALNALTDYGATNNRSSWQPDPKVYDKDAQTYDGQDAKNQRKALADRIQEKYDDVISGDSTSSFVKIFAMSDADELMQRMATAALTFDEMVRTVDYLSGSVDADVAAYLHEEEDGSWTGIFSDQTTEWRSKKNADNTDSFNAGWSFFDDWEMYDALKKYAQDKDVKSASNPAKNRNEDEKNLASDNAAWHYRSILKKVYTEVKLPGAAAARLATYMLDYAVEIVETKSRGTAAEAITGTVTYEYNAFARYCKAIPAKSDPFSGLKDYDTLSYLLSFDQYYDRSNGGNGLQKCVTLYGYYYDYNQTYYKESLADEDEYAKQLYYEKLSVFTDEEWLDYVRIQRKNYTSSYRYKEDFYRTFYQTHFGFQAVIESFDDKVYDMARVVSTEMTNAEKPGKTYTSEMLKAITKSGSIDGVMGQLALSDWMWCYSGVDANMKAYNQANTMHEEGKDSGRSEQEKRGQFYHEMEELKIVYYLLDKMTKAELDSALYYQVYAYSASMLDEMQSDVKKYVYIDDSIETGSTYTKISAEVLAKGDAAQSDTYAMGKINVLYNQTKTEWSRVNPDEKAASANTQSWTTMKTEIKDAMDYDYDGMGFKKNTEWKEKCERLEDLVIARIWSCCNQKVSEAIDSKCDTGHATNKDGTVATKEYDTKHAISQFVSNYEEVLYHIAGQSKVSFNTISKGYITHESTAIATSTTWKAGYFGTISDLRSVKPERPLTTKEAKTITVSSGKVFIEDVEPDDAKSLSEDASWWETNKSAGGSGKKDTNYGPEEVTETYSQEFKYEYSYKFVGWYLDQNWMYEFDEEDEVTINLTLYAGYDITKTKQ